MKRLKLWLATWLAPQLKFIFLDLMYEQSIKQNTELLSEVRNLLQEAQENGLDIYTEINPMLMAPFAVGLGYTEQPEDKKDNPFKLVEIDEEE